MLVSGRVIICKKTTQRNRTHRTHEKFRDPNPQPDNSIITQQLATYLTERGPLGFGTHEQQFYLVQCHHTVDG